jgi:hypothetical protein
MRCSLSLWDAASTNAKTLGDFSEKLAEDEWMNGTWTCTPYSLSDLKSYCIY